MFVIPPNHVKLENQNDRKVETDISLKSHHVYISHDLAKEVFGDDLNIFCVFYPTKNTLMCAPISDELFKKIHKASQHMLKNRNAKGDKTIALHEILIDHEVDISDRELSYDFQKALGVLSINF